jgi:CRISPR-associated protein Csm2
MRESRQKEEYCMSPNPQYNAASAQPRPVPVPTPDQLKQIVVEGNAETTVTLAKSLGDALAYQLTSSQIRSVFTTARQIEMNWPVREDSEDSKLRARKAARQLVLLKPKLAYQASREQRGSSGMKSLAAILSQAIDLVQDNRARFQNFIDFFEAILAYHVAAGGQMGSERRA